MALSVTDMYHHFLNSKSFRLSFSRKSDPSPSHPILPSFPSPHPRLHLIPPTLIPISTSSPLYADALRLYLINSPVVRADVLKFQEEGTEYCFHDMSCMTSVGSAFILNHSINSILD